jgi:hypothetical protein
MRTFGATARFDDEPFDSHHVGHEEVRAFEMPFGGRARLAGLTQAQLYALRGHQVIEVGAEAITVVTRTAARLRVFRSEPDPSTVLAWTLCDRT